MAHIKNGFIGFFSTQKQAFSEFWFDTHQTMLRFFNKDSMSLEEVEALLVQAAREDQGHSKNEHGRTDLCIDSSQIQAVLLNKGKWKYGEEEHMAHCRFCTTTLKIVQHQIENPLSVAQPSTKESCGRTIT